VTESIGTRPDDLAVGDRERIATPSQPRVIYETRIVICGPEEDTAMAAVKLRAFLRRCPKPPGLSIRLADEHNRLESTRGSPY
jgi:hypothetical protein